MTDNRTDSQASRGQAGSGLPVPAALSAESLPVPQRRESEERPISPVDALASGDMDARTKFVGSVHEYVREYIRLADQKATFFFAGATALLAFLFKNEVSARWLKAPLSWNLLDIIALVAMVGLAIGAFLALLVVIPRTPGSRRGFIFWEAVAEYRQRARLCGRSGDVVCSHTVSDQGGAYVRPGVCMSPQVQDASMVPAARCRWPSGISGRVLVSDGFRHQKS